jgi:integrase
VRSFAAAEQQHAAIRAHKIADAASLAIQAGAAIKALQNLLGHESAGLTLDRYGHRYGSDVEAVGIAINALLTRNCGQTWARRWRVAIPARSYES